VFFYIDAAVMKPDSKFEVDKLLEMLKENPNYKIKIHGHTNGNSHGKIIRMGESKNFFALVDTEEGFGSAKQLSEERANTIRDFLVANGVEESRMIVKAWGGKRPIHDKHSQRAHENVRVEVEILQD
jgi:outer membrane protein OmpA-like peptidoglycan-associated protein